MQVKNLVKTYKLKNEIVEALKGVSFDLPDRGMVFILGKSGCGKTTLLNVLSGLDNFDGGDVIFKGKSLKNLTSAELDSYRNTYCGFVFQEYNLLPELNVKNNVMLALQLRGDKMAESKVIEALKKVGLEGFETRKVTELSGGQKQRVAIARCIIKEPQIIFADEPSGALDSETGEGIFEILKELSKDKLVITVSHDIDCAIKFSDRIIELCEGEVMSDTQSGFKARSEESSKIVTRHSKMPISAAFKMGCSNLRFHPIRLVATIFLAMIAFSMFGIALNPVLSDLGSIMYNTMSREKIEQCYVVKEKIAPIELGSSDGAKIDVYFGEKDRAEIEKYAKVTIPVYTAITSISNAGELNSDIYRLPIFLASITENELESFGFGLDGKLPGEGEIAITKYTADALVESGLQVDGNLIKFGANELKGKTLLVDGKEYIICGIIDTRLSEDVDVFKKQVKNEVDYSAHNLLFVSKNSGYSDEDSFLSRGGSISKEIRYTKKVEVDGREEERIYMQRINLDINKIANASKCDSLVSFNDNNGVYINYFNFERFMPNLAEWREEYKEQHIDELYLRAQADGYEGTIEEYKSNVVTSDKYSYFRDIVYAVTQAHREDIQGFTVLYMDVNGKSELNVKGFFYDNEMDTMGIAYADGAIYSDYYETIGGIYRGVVISRSITGLKNIRFFIGENDYSLVNVVASAIFDNSVVLGRIKGIMTYFSIAFAVFAVILLLNFMLHSIGSRTNTIGILKSLGCSNINLISVFIWEGIVVGALTFAASILGLAIGGWFMNIFLSTYSGGVYIALFGLTLPVVAVLLGIIAVFTMIGCVLPIVRLSRLKPMEYLNKAL